MCCIKHPDYWHTLGMSAKLKSSQDDILSLLVQTPHPNSVRGAFTTASKFKNIQDVPTSWRRVQQNNRTVNHLLTDSFFPLSLTRVDRDEQVLLG